MLKVVRELFERMNAEGICYCHWKSNVGLQEALDGLGDLDLLIHPATADRFESIRAALQFKLAARPVWQTHPSVQHYYGLDYETGRIVHLHVYFKLVTGGSLVKACWLPLEQMLVENTRFVGPVCVPTKPAELVVFLVRKMVEFSSPLESRMALRESEQIQRELGWLVEEDSIQRAQELLKLWLPSLDADTFKTAVEALRRRRAMGSRFVLAYRVKRKLRQHFLGSPIWQECVRGQRLLRWAMSWTLSRRPRSVLLRGGSVIAIVGPEASGKSTLVCALRQWLAEHFSVATIHAGKPPSTVWTHAVDFLLPVLRRILPGYRSHRIKAEMREAGVERIGRLRLLFYGLRAVMLAYNRGRLIRRAFRWASRGTLVVSDRYPTSEIGAVDSAQLDVKSVPPRVPLMRFLAALEHRIYRRIPPPSIVLRLWIPVEVAVERNAGRQKDESEEYVRQRHARMSVCEFRVSRVVDLDTQRSLEETILAAKRSIWETL